jgi:hypothetical protein
MGRLEAAHAQLLHAAARRALAARQEGNRRYLLGFERDIAARWHERTRAAQPPETAPVALETRRG